MTQMTQIHTQGQYLRQSAESLGKQIESINWQIVQE